MLKLAYCVLVLGYTGVLAQPPQPAQEGVENTTTMRAWNTLNEGIQDKDVQHKTKALVAIATIGDMPQAVKLAEQGLQDKNLLVRQAAASALGDIGSKDAIPALKAAIDDASPEVRFTAAKALWSAGDYEDADAFLWQVMTGERRDAPTFKEGALRQAKKKLQPSELVLMGFHEAGGLLGPASIAVDAVEEGAKAAKPGAGAPGRVVTAGVLAKDKDPYSLALLEWAMSTDDSPAVRVAAAKALGDRGNQDTIPKLEARLGDDHHEVRYMAAASIIKLSKKQPEPATASAPEQTPAPKQAVAPPQLQPQRATQQTPTPQQPPTVPPPPPPPPPPPQQ